jgi:probable F420-dependent oxidoreductase
MTYEAPSRYVYGKKLGGDQKMNIDAVLPPTSLNQVAALAVAAEEIGFDALWSAETQHDPFLPMALISQNTQRLQMGTAVAIGFARSPATLAYTSWDLAEASGGRFILGLGTQVKAHIERRFGMPWPKSPVGKLREMIQAIRAFWKAWQTGERLNYRGEYFKHTLMSPFFTPGPIPHPEIPIYIAGVNTGLCRLAGEVADGFHVHPYHSREYLREVVLPSIEQGLEKENRHRGDIALCVTALAASDPDEKEFIRSQISFYASTPTYRPVMAHHGWGEVADQLRDLSRRGEWGEMPKLISEEMLGIFATVASQGELAAALKERYNGIADRMTLYLPYLPGDRDDFWRRFVSEMHRS